MNEKKKICWTTQSMRKRGYGKRQKIVNNGEKKFLDNPVYEEKRI